MKTFITVLFTLAVFFAQAQSTTLTAGQAAPEVKLKNINNKNISFKSFPKAKGFIVVFTCNTCPYAMAYEQRIIELNKKFAPMGYPVIAINPNDPEASEADSFDEMQKLAKKKKYAFPYLFDKGQAVTNAYGAMKTPHIFIVSNTDKGHVIEYTGAIDNDTEGVKATRTRYAEDVIASLMKNEKPAITATKAIGCTVKRKKA